MLCVFMLTIAAFFTLEQEKKSEQGLPKSGGCYCECGQPFSPCFMGGFSRGQIGGAGRGIYESREGGNEGRR